ncbi:MAG: hypothetical protein QOI78_7036 [Actinomycetota bacterium]|nr:hypothetical protein [Actinomycetota bacterium]
MSGEHVHTLATMDEELPPIIVHRPTMRVIDGAHRLRAAELRARRHIEVRFFDGDEDDAFVLAVEANTANGLSLSVEDRKAAAARIIVTHPTRSDRWIASVAGLAATTVGALRRCSSVSDTQSNTRVGRDGRTRPLDSSEGRRLAGELMRTHPNRSLRDIARAVGIAPSTVLDVRNRLSRGADAVPTRRENPGKASGAGRDPGAPRRQGGSRAPLDLPPDAIMRTLRQDPSLRFNEAGRALLRWLDKHNVAGQALPPLGDVPTHCLSTIAALAQHNARYWAELGDRVGTLDADRLPTEGAG